MSKRKRRRRRRTLSENILIGVSLLIASSMVISLFIIAIPGPPNPTPVPLPTWTPAPTSTSAPPPEPSATPPPEPSPTMEATEAPAGPVLPTNTPAITPTLTVTPASSSLEFTFAVGGDSRDNPRVYRKVLEAITADSSEFLIHTGDLVNKGTEDQWQEFKEIMAGFELPFYPVPGNHDALAGKLDGYVAHSGAPANHYSFVRGPIHFALADSHNGGISNDELAWLRDDLSAASQPIKMVFLHHPPFDPDGTDHIMAFGNDDFMELMIEQGVDYVFAGHIHAYAQEERDGVVYTITGGAGAPLYTTGHPQAFHHYLRVSVLGEEVSIKVIKV